MLGLIVLKMNSKQPKILMSFLSTVGVLFYVLVMFQCYTTISASKDNGNETDHQALLKIKSMITQDPYRALISWNNSLHFCDWSGVTCGKRHRRVTYLRLSSLGQEGYLSPHVGNLSFLRGFSVTNNSFQGVIPHELGRLSRLRFLYLGHNKFNGVVPANISGCYNLEELDISYNELIGSIPNEISFLSKLSFLSLQNNKLSGGIPPSIGNITSMELFSVKENRLGGSIPNTIGQWKSLKEIYSSHCNLSGSIPHSFYNLSLLTTINLADNQLSGSLPQALGAMLPHLVLLQLWGNQLSGPLPSSIANCSRLADLELARNMLSGKLIVDFAKLREIEFISIGFNNFGSNEVDEMKFIDSLQNCTRLEMLDVAHSKFQGVLPKSIGNLSDQLLEIYLYANQLHGSIPISIGRLVGLRGLHLDRNQFTGNIPTTIGNLQNLQRLHLYENQLSGQIPDAIGNLSSLISLNLVSNQLEEVIPSSLGNCHRLLELNLNNNKFNGKIPKQLFKLSSLSITLDLSQNKLFGSLPKEVGDLKKLTALDLSYNNLSGNIPTAIGGCASLSRLSLKNNLFQGILPPSLSSLKGLEQLDVSYNNLSGQFPQFLKGLLYLNLSYNDFGGEVPTSGVFSNKTTFSILGNSRLCGGYVELKLPKCKETKKHKIHVFVIVILIVSIVFTTIICLTYIWYKKKDKNQLSRSSTSKRFLKVSYNQLLKGTDGFSESNLIGNGGFSSVYKGILDEYDDRFVAIKVLHLQNRGAQTTFMRECEAWRNIRHRNLLKIITSCSSVDFQGNDFKALVYEYMPNGSLHDWLHPTSRLNLLQIINILMDVACALDYIHNQCIPSVVHGDLKPSNILLDDDMVAHVGDFGLARFLGTTSYQSTSTEIRGTIGYAAPEYGVGNEMTSSGDVYSFGILLLEAMTGKTPTNTVFTEGFSLHKYASLALLDHVMDVIDVNILNVYRENETFMQSKEANAKKIEECLTSIVKIGVSCTMDSPSQRMDTKKVMHELQHIQDALPSI